MESSFAEETPRLQMLVLDRSDPAQNMARFYVLAIEPTLFGDVALVREWGRRGCSDGGGWISMLIERLQPRRCRTGSSGRRDVATASQQLRWRMKVDSWKLSWSGGPAILRR
ncbi:WGR domain-containing protein [Bosea thiooxidans]